MSTRQSFKAVEQQWQTVSTNGALPAVNSNNGRSNFDYRNKVIRNHVIPRGDVVATDHGNTSPTNTGEVNKNQSKKVKAILSDMELI